VIKIIFQNEHVIVVDKEAGTLTVPARPIPGKESDPRPVLGLEVQKLLQRQVFPVHRLDFEVSGLVIFALSASAHRDLSRCFEKRKVYKTYQALSLPIEDGAVPQQQRLKWSSKILRGKKRAYESEQGLSSETEAIFEGNMQHSVFGFSSKWILHPLTGRSHQLRYEMYKNKYPILNDILYGGAAVPGLTQKIALRAVALKFDHHRAEDQRFLQKYSIPEKLAVDGFW
jgi:tRNA pseudouridine32 synthase/23S rRNA pseudouridine746 synthase